MEAAEHAESKTPPPQLPPGSPLPHAVHLAGKKPHFPLTKLPTELFRKVVHHLQRAKPEAILELALTSKKMHKDTFINSKLMRNRLCFQAKNALTQPNGSTVLENVIAEINNKKNHFDSEDRLGIIKSMKESLIGNDPPLSLKGTQELMAIVENLQPEHQCEAIFHVYPMLHTGFNEEVNKDFFDRLAKLAKSAQTDEDKAWGLSVLQALKHIPITRSDETQDRITRFDQLAPSSETITSDKEHALSLKSISQAIAVLSPAAAAERLERYVKSAHSINNSVDKCDAIMSLAYPLRAVPEERRLDIFRELVVLKHSLDPYDQADAFLVLADDLQHLPITEYASARRSLISLGE